MSGGNAIQSGSRSNIVARTSVSDEPANARARQHFIQHAAEGPDVCSRIELFRLSLLGRHVGRGAHDGHFLRQGLGDSWRVIGVGRRTAMDFLGEAEVENLDLQVIAHFDVSRLQIPVNDGL